jgi:hypothetical protein
MQEQCNQTGAIKINITINNVTFLNNYMCYIAGICHLTKDKVYTTTENGSAIQTIAI